MPFVTSCPDCARKLRVPDELLGKKVRCPGCKVVFTAVADSDKPEEAPPPPRRPAPPRDERIEQDPRPRRAPPPPPQDEDDSARIRQRDDEQDFQEDEDELPRGRRMREDDEYGEEAPRSSGSRAGWRSVRIGVTFLLIGVSLYAISVIVNLIGSLATASVRPGFGPPPVGVPVAAPVATSGLSVVCSILQMLLQLGWVGTKVVAYFFFLNVPVRSGARRLAVTLLSLISVELLGILAACGLAFSLGMGMAMVGSPQLVLSAGIGLVIVGVIVLLSFLAETVVSLLFFKSISLALKARGLATSWNYQLILFGVIAAMSLLFAGIMAVMVGSVVSSARTGAPASATVNAIGGASIAMGCLGCVDGLMGLGWIIWYVVSLVQLNGVLKYKV
jgi:hypothetical protein